jgi:N-methylhydantoinase A
MFIGTDVGGTFTDFVYFDGKEMNTFKVFSTPRNPEKAVEYGLDLIRSEISLDEFENIILSHASTVATNTILERKGVKTALITTAGFRDVIEIARQNRPRLYDLYSVRPKPLIPRNLRFEVKERIDKNGKVIRDLKEDEVREIVEKLKKEGVESVAVIFLFSFLYPDHEKKVKEILRKELDIEVSISTEVLPEIREYERGSTTVLDAYIKPIVKNYLSSLEMILKPLGIKDLYVMQSSGGVVKAKSVRQRPVYTILSGPAGGVAASKFLGDLFGEKNLLTFDMGGTSTDVSSIVDGVLSWTSEGSIVGYPIKVPMIEISTIGAGGGSIAWIDEGGALRVGPRSAGSDPGPICYGKGGKDITVTDSNLLLGYLHEDLFLMGKMRLERDLALKEADKFAKKISMDLESLLLGIWSVANSNMVRALRVISVEKGYDPADFKLVSYGGAGPMHAGVLAKELGVPEVIVPNYPGVFSAFGLLVSDIKLDYSRSVLLEADSRAKEKIDWTLSEFYTQGEKDLQEQGVEVKRAIFISSLDMRYKGQSYEINVPYSGNLQEVIEEFYKIHDLRYGYSVRGEAVEIVNLRLTVLSPRYSLPYSRPQKGNGEEWGREEAVFEIDGDVERIETPLYLRDNLYSGFKEIGPCVIFDPGSTIVVYPDMKCRVDKYGNLRIEV